MKRLSSEFDVCAVGTEPALADSFAKNGLRYHSYRMSRRANPLTDVHAVGQLVRIFRAERPAIVHTFDTKPAVWGRLAAKLAGVPVVIGTLPGLGSLYTRTDLKAQLIRIVYQPLQTLVCRWADVTTFQNDDDAQEFVKRRVVSQTRVTVIPGSGIPTDVFMPLDPASAALRRAELGLDDEIVVVMISRILRSKGVLDFAAAGRAASDANRRVRFLLVGQHDAESLDRLSPDELQRMRESVTWLGRRDDVKEILGAADIFVLPSFYREGIPRVLLEAASMRLPLVAADVPGSRDVVEDGVNGFLVEPRDPNAITDAVLRLADTPELRRRFGEKSRELAVRRFDLTVVAAQTASLYQRLLATKRPS
jgi:glycosyltransferase involved in cell wall biosynthesis